MTDFEARYAKLQARFLASVPERLDGIREALRVGDFALARRAAHNLKGTAESLEASSIGEPMRQLEAALDSVLASGSTPSASELAELEAYCDGLT